MFVHLTINLTENSDWKFRKSPINPDAVKSNDGSKRADVVVSPQNVAGMKFNQYVIRMCDIAPEEIDSMDSYLTGNDAIESYQLTAED